MDRIPLPKTNGTTNGNGERRRKDGRRLVPAGWFAQKGGGRPPGTKNKIPYKVQNIVLQAIEELGEDGRGKNGAVGYLKAVARRHPEAYLRLIEKLIPAQAKLDVEGSVEVTDARNRLLSKFASLEGRVVLDAAGGAEAIVLEEPQ